MGTKTFDLAETISDLLKRIDKGRKTVRETQHVSDDLCRAYANRDKADQLLTELRRKVASSAEPAQSQAKAELDRQVSERQKLDDESNRLWLRCNKTTAFIGPFISDVSLLLERLPLKPDWDVYRQAVGRLDVGERGSWTDPPASPALETLEMRLREMQGLAVRMQRGRVRRFEPFRTPDGTTWKDVSITFISDHRVQIAVLGVTDTRNYAEMGFADNRGAQGQKPIAAWLCLNLLAQNAGTIKRPEEFKSNRSPLEKQIQTVRTSLRELFQITDDPFEPFHEAKAYKARFSISCADSCRH
ncbi:MAG: hypothetical protein ABSC05_38860 [Candidatus Solibacter sp.]